jgi:hypothetical protein
MNIGIHAVEQADLFRYNSFWLKHSAIKPSVVFLFSDENITNTTFNKFKNIGLKCIHVNTFFMKPSTIQNFINKNDINLLVLNALSVTDLRFLVFDTPKNCKIVYVQHGLYIPFMKRSLSFYITSFKKVLSYFYYSWLISHNFKHFISILLVFINGNTRLCFTGFYKKLDLAFVFSRYWRSWHRHHYKLSSKYIIIGSPDFSSFTTIPVHNSIIYCAQTLVEDGRISKKIMFNFYSELKNYAERVGKNIIVKTHPRNSKETIEHFNSLEFIISQKDIPIGDLVIGHYSSLLPLWCLNKTPLLVCELPDHPTPISIKKISSEVVNTLSSFDIELFPNEKVNYYFGDKIETELFIKHAIENTF